MEIFISLACFTCETLKYASVSFSMSSFSGTGRSTNSIALSIFLSSAVIEVTLYVHHAFLLFGNDVISLESSPLIFMYLHTRT